MPFGKEETQRSQQFFAHLRKTQSGACVDEAEKGGIRYAYAMLVDRDPCFAMLTVPNFALLR